MTEPTSPVVTQSLSRRTMWARRSVVALLPLVLVGAAWEVRHLQEPVNVYYSRRNTPSHILFERLAKEAREHPFAKSISIQGPTDGGSLPSGEGINYLPRVGYLEYGILDSGWSYTQVELSGIELLALSSPSASRHTLVLSRGATAQKGLDTGVKFIFGENKHASCGHIPTLKQKAALVEELYRKLGVDINAPETPSAAKFNLD